MFKKRIFVLFIPVIFVLNTVATIFSVSAGGKTAAFLLGGSDAVVDGQIKQIDAEAEVAPFEMVGKSLIPLRFTAESFGASVNFDADTSYITVTLSGREIKLKMDSDTMIINGQESKMEAPVQKIADRTFIPFKAAGEAFGKKIFTDNRGMMILSDREFDAKKDKQEISETYFKLSNQYYFAYSHNQDYVDLETFHSQVKFDIPTAEMMIADLKKTNPNNNHPRLIVTQDRFDFLKEKIANEEEPYLKWFNNLIYRAKSILPTEPAKYEDDDPVRMLAPHSYTWSRTLTLGLAYKLTEDKVYADRLYYELETAAGFPDWNHKSQFLDTAFMTGCFAVGYDWLYDYMTDEQKTIISGAMIEKGIEWAIVDYKSGHEWTKTPDNWAGVCNGGIGMACLAILDENEELAGEALAFAMEKVVPLLIKPEPDGQNEEGPHYWNYGTGQWFIYLASSLNAALGTDYGYLDKNGIRKTMYYLPYMGGPVSTFRMHDDDGNMSGVAVSESALWCATRFKDPSLGAYYARYLRENPSRGDIFELLWYDPEYADADYDVRMLPDKYFRESETILMKSSWNDYNAAFVGFHSGSNHSSHATMNTGIFDIQALGEQWTAQLGRDSYTDPAYFRYDMGYDTDGENMAARYGYYRVRAESGNTIVINPDHRPDQNWDAFSRMQRVEFKPRGGFGITDMTGAYSRDALKIERGVMLTHDREWIVVQDEIDLLDPSVVYWFMHTRADVEITDDGKSAVLSIGNKKMWVGLQSPANAKFEIMDAAPLPETTFPLINNTENIGVRKLAIKMMDVINTRISVIFVPMMSRDVIVPNDLPAVTALKKWEIPDGVIPPKPPSPLLDEITINGEAMEGFTSKKYDYKVKLPFETESVPKIDAKSAHSFEIKQADALPGIASVTVTDKDNPDNKSYYYFEMDISPKEGLLEDLAPYKIERVATSSEPQPEHPAIAVLDDSLDPESRWSADGMRQWIQLDLGKELPVDVVSIFWLNGHTRIFKYGIETSKDGENWEEVANGQSTGEIKDYETYWVKSSNARYVRIVGYGNSDNGWISIISAKIGKYAK